jgi:hypothetical protein
MRKIICPHCHTENRRPRCGNCQGAIPEPSAIELAWILYDNRKRLAIAGGLAMLVLGLWRPWESLLFGPTNYSECRQQAARHARSNAAMFVLLSECSSKFLNKP